MTRMKNPSELAAAFMTGPSVESCPIINMHSHAGAFAATYFPNRSDEAQVQSLRRCGVRTSFVSTHTALFDAGGGNEVTAGLVRAYPNDYRGYWVVHPNYPRTVEQDLVTALARPEFVGLKFLAGYHHVTLDDDKYRPAWEYADAHRLPVLAHTWGGCPYNGAAHVRPIAERYPNVRLLLAHCISNEWREAVKIVNAHPNVQLDLTGIMSLGGMIEELVAGVGSERIFYGDDAPWFEPHYEIGCLMFSRVTDEDRHNILHRNAERLFAPELAALPLH